ncbi:MAG: hypothetical protein AABZ39_07500 [Spirochaetota bacterium]
MRIKVHATGYKSLPEGGGDCDDWVGMTAGALRFWGYEPSVAAGENEYVMPSALHG